MDHFLSAARRGAAWRGIVLVLLCWCGSTQAQFTGIHGTVVRFASVAQGREALRADDDWARATGDFQRAAVTGAPGPVSRERFLAFQADAVLAWPAQEEARWRQALSEIAPRLNALHVPLPPEVLLVNSNGRDEANAPYTRGRAVVLPSQTLRNDGYTDAELLAHELFHVISRARPELATRLYAAIGFESAPDLQWPAQWLPMRIANPDAPYDRHVMRTTVDGRPVALMPVLVAARTELDPARGETFFDVMELRLLEVAVAAGRPTLPVMRDGQPVWHSPQQARLYVMRLGGNTGYILHPEETMADNFAFLVSGRSVPNPTLIQRVQALLTGAAP